MGMRKSCILTFVGILSLSVLLTGFSAGKAQAFCERYPFFCRGWTHDQILLVPPIVMNDAFTTDLFDQRAYPIPYKYSEVVKLLGHSCGATSGGWVITRKALDMLYPGEIPERGNIRVYCDGAEDEWNFGVIGEAISFITGAASSGGFKGAEFGPGNPIYIRKDKMIFGEALGHHPKPGCNPQAEVCWPFVRWKFQDIPTGDQVCIEYWLGQIVPNPKTDPVRAQLGASVAAGTATEQEAIDFAAYWNERVEYVFENADMLVKGYYGECPDWPRPPPQ
jgi:hypothetical protein